MGGALRHASAATAGTEATALARKGDQALCAAGPTPEPREAAREEPALQERAKLIVDEPRQPVTLTLTTRFGAEGLKVIADDVVEHRRD